MNKFNGILDEFAKRTTNEDDFEYPIVVGLCDELDTLYSLGDPNDAPIVEAIKIVIKYNTRRIDHEEFDRLTKGIEQEVGFDCTSTPVY